MKKKPIYLYVLLSLSVVGNLFSIWGRLTAVYTLPEESLATLPEPVRTELPAYLEKASALVNSLPSNIFFFGSLAILIAAIVFVVRKDIFKANLAYIAYMLFGLVATAYSYVSTRSLLYSSFSDASYISAQMSLLTTGIIIGVLFSLVVLGIVVFKLIKQQKEVETEPASSEN